MKPSDVVLYERILRLTMWVMLLGALVLLLLQMAVGLFPLGFALVCAMLLVELAIRYREDGRAR